jgi:hypothetical protein
MAFSNASPHRFAVGDMLEFCQQRRHENKSGNTPLLTQGSQGGGAFSTFLKRAFLFMQQECLHRKSGGKNLTAPNA